jgi:ribonuclease P protein component
LIGRIVRSVDFERVMGTPSRAKTRHFVLQHLTAVPSQAGKPGAPRRKVGALDQAAATELSTAQPTAYSQLVDDSLSKRANAALRQEAIWLGLVVPKRHAKRSVTRQLLKRQMRAAVVEQQNLPHHLSHGLWVLRLRNAFEVAQFPSAASKTLAQAARSELKELLQRAASPAMEAA